MIPKFHKKHLRNVNGGGDNKPAGSNGHLLNMFQLGAFVQGLILFGMCFNSSFGFQKVTNEELSFFGANGAKSMNDFGLPVHHVLIIFAMLYAYKTDRLGPFAFVFGAASCFSLFASIGLGIDYYHGVHFKIAEYSLFVFNCFMIGEILLWGLWCEIMLYWERKEAEENAQDIDTQV